MTTSLSDMLTQYHFNKKADIHSSLVCPVCGHTFDKSRKSHAFCCNWYTQTDGSPGCKEQFWTAVHKSARLTDQAADILESLNK